jgi:hypothetical protein
MPTFQQLPTRVAKLAATMIPQSAALDAGEKTIMKKLSHFVNGNTFAVVAIMPMTATAIGLFQAVIRLTK